MKTLSCKHNSDWANVLVRLDFQENNHALLPLKQHLQTVHNAHSTVTNLMELRHRTTQHSGDEPAQEDVFCFPLLSTNKAIQAGARVRAKWTYQSHLGVRQVEAKRIGCRCPCQKMASCVCHIALTVPGCNESMFVYVPEARAPCVEIRVSVCVLSTKKPVQLHNHN